MVTSKINISDFGGIRTIDVIGLLYDYKKIISIGIPDRFLGNLKQVFGKYNLKWATIDEKYDFKNQQKTYIISKKEAYIKKAQKAYSAGKFDKVGEYLGYPRCCIDFYWKRHNVRFSRIIGEIHQRSKNFFWLLNNIFNYEGRFTDTRKYTRYMKKNVGDMSFIAHVPCSFDCLASLKIAALNYKYLFFHNALNAYATYILRQPVLYRDDYHFIIFEGHSKKNYIRYKNISFYLGWGKVKNVFLQGDTVEIDSNRLIIYHGRKKVTTLQSKHDMILLPFDQFL